MRFTEVPVNGKTMNGIEQAPPCRELIRHSFCAKKLAGRLR